MNKAILKLNQFQSITDGMRNENRTIGDFTLGALLFGISLLMVPGGVVNAIDESTASYHTELERINHALQSSNQIASSRPDSWIALETVALNYLERARLTGTFSDYLASQSAIDRAFALAKGNNGPYLARARLNYSIHRLPDIEADLDRVMSAILVDENTVDAVRGIRADVFLNSAMPIEAKMHYDQLESIKPGVLSATRLAHYAVYVGNYNEADRWFNKAEQRVEGESQYLRAWLKLQLGIVDLEQGKLDEARAHYLEGDRLFPGFWLIEEHIAEIDSLQGRYHIAEESYRDLIKRTGSPLFMSALADILSVKKDSAAEHEAQSWQAMAAEVYELQSRQMPELMSGHTLDFFLQAGDFTRALELARSNAQLRPGGKNSLQLVQAYASVGDISEANKLMDVLLSSPFRSADLYATAGVLLRHSGDASKADEFDSLALSINPMSIDDVSWLKARMLEDLPVEKTAQVDEYLVAE